MVYLGVRANPSLCQSRSESFAQKQSSCSAPHTVKSATLALTLAARGGRNMRWCRSCRSSSHHLGTWARERVVAGKVIDRLAGGVSLGSKLEPYFWEHEPMRATADYQGNIPSPSEFDIVVCILWSRLGSRLNPNYGRADGSPYDSGTEYELDVADRARKLHNKPEILVYRNQQQPMIPISPAEVREEKVRQYREAPGLPAALVSQCRRHRPNRNQRL